MNHAKISFYPVCSPQGLLLLLRGAIVSGGVIVLLALGCVSNTPHKTFDAWLDDFAAEWMKGDPMASTTAQYFDGSVQDEMDRRLTPITKDFRATRVALARHGLTQLATFDLSLLRPEQRESAEMLKWQLDDYIRADAFEDYRYVFQQYGGLEVRLVRFLSQIHPIRNLRDVENYLARLKLVAGQVDDGIGEARQRASRGILPPNFILTATIAQFDRFLADAPNENVLVTSLTNRMESVNALTVQAKMRFTAAAEETVNDSIIPAFRRARELLQSQLSATKSDAGLWRFQEGDKIYADALRHFTTTDMTAEQIHELGLAEVARVETEMDALLRQIGYVNGSVKERIAKLEHDSQPPSSPDPRPDLLAEYERILRDAERRAATLFAIHPAAEVVVKEEPVFTEKNAAAHYESPARDGSRPGIVYVPLPGPNYDVIEMKTLLYHEGVPGHHFQVALQMENESLPKFRRLRAFGGITTYSEGWALYAERLVAESGWYENDLKGKLGQLNKELFRAQRLVVDTGIHSSKYRWTRQQAIDYGIPAREVDRYVVGPGQACAYEIGMIKILQSRERAQKALGGKFSLNDFHSALLRAGPVPMAVLDEAVNDYIKALQ